ncbi:MAG: hypothetical protein J6B34_02705 [Clostridia bacterium]|nr:hypothetical protein [Clostridia bacterium]
MKDLIKAIDNLPWIVKLILCLPGIAIVWSIYRLVRSIAANNVLAIVLSILLLFFGPTIVWIIDLVCVILNKKVWWLC